MLVNSLVSERSLSALMHEIEAVGADCSFRIYEVIERIWNADKKGEIGRRRLF